MDIIEDLASYLDDKGFIGSDVSADVSLGDYGFLWNPETNKAISTLPGYYWEDEDPKFHIDHITVDQVREALQEIEDGFFDFIGSNRENELDNLDKNNVPYYVESIEQYSGLFRLKERFPYTADEIKSKVK